MRILITGASGLLGIPVLMEAASTFPSAKVYGTFNTCLPEIISSYAENIWDHYYSARSDVEKLRFDDIDEPETPPVEDDAKLHPPSRDSLNYAYKLKGSKIYDVDALNRQSEEKIKLLCYDIMDAFSIIKTEYFGEEYAQYKCEFNEEDEEMVIIMIEDMLSQQSKLFFEHKYANQ
jgi:hypothetical protein